MKIVITDGGGFGTGSLLRMPKRQNASYSNTADDHLVRRYDPDETSMETQVAIAAVRK